jgi:hypothetical protein
MVTTKGSKMPQVAFQAPTSEGLVEQALRWALETLQASHHTSLLPGASELRAVIERVQGVQARAFLRSVAERSCAGQTLSLVEAAAMSGRAAEPSAFVGVVGAVNRPMKRRGGRRLILWEPTTRSYRMDAADAAVVLKALGE